MSLQDFKVPSKTFLLGEYAVLYGGSALVLTHPPFFRIQKTKVPKKKFHKESPASLLMKKHGLSQDFDFIDPHKDGGFGGSTAEVVASLKNKTNHSFKKILEDYLNLFSDQFLKPSGADLYAQWLGVGLGKSQVVPFYSDLNKNIFSKTDFNKVDFNKADLNESNLNKVDLNKADLNESNLNKVDLNKVDLNESNLNKVDLNKIEKFRSQPFGKSQPFGRSQPFTRSQPFGKSQPFTRSWPFGKSQPFGRSKPFGRSWPFKDVALMIFKRPKKQKTHEHLKNLSLVRFAHEDYKPLIDITTQGLKSFFAGESSFFHQISRFTEMQKNLSLIDEEAFMEVSKIGEQKSVICARACGALGMDVVTVFCSLKEDLDKVKAEIVDFNFNYSHITTLDQGDFISD